MARRKKDPVAPHPEPKPHLVLIADDDRGIVTRVREGLSSQPYHFVEASDGPQVLTAIREHHPDLLLMDVEMPGLGGVEVCRIVKANPSFGFVPIILMTARRGGKVEGLELGADDYLFKPFDMMELSARVKSMLRLKALQDVLVEKHRQLDLANKALEEQRQQLETLARTDGLTGLLNRRHFDERLEAEFSRSLRYHAPLSCLLIDIDHFKEVNDTHGHQVGDQVIQQVAAATRRVLRDVDVLARYGGEELVALLPETSVEEARRAAERVRGGIEQTQMVTKVGPSEVLVKCTASLGVSTFPSPGIETPHALLRMADQGLYSAKQSGRNRVGDVGAAPAHSKLGTKRTEAL